MGVSLTIKGADIVAALGQMDPNAPLDAVMQSWGSNAKELLAIEIFNVTKRTLDRAHDTGALASSVTGRAYDSAKSGTLISVWFNPAQQYAQWNRYYAPYQEGPPLGLSTYTNGPRHMLYDSLTDDAEQVGQWAVDTGQQGADEWAGSLPTD